jgi:DNA-binding beta-propeller fold protein YncE
VGVAVDAATHTVYVANNENGDSPGNLSMINATTCNGTDISGCSASFPTAPLGISPRLVAVDASTGAVYVTDASSASLSVINGADCNASMKGGCGTPAIEEAVGSRPNGIAIDPTSGAVYVMNTLAPGSMSVLRGWRPGAEP